MNIRPPSKPAARSFGLPAFLYGDLWSKLVRFGIVGVLNTAVDYAVFLFCLQVAGLPLLAANTVAFLVAVNISYVMNKSWTFRDGSRGMVAITRAALFLASYTLGFLIGSAVLWWASHYVDPQFAKLASIGTTFVVNFVLSRTVVFRPS
jgi:Predicted membrane protein